MTTIDTLHGLNGTNGAPKTQEAVETFQLPLKDGLLVLGDVQTFDTKWRSTSGPVTDGKYVVDIEGERAEHYAKLSHEHKATAVELADGTWRITMDNERTGRLLQKTLENSVKVNKTATTVRVSFRGATKTLARDSTRGTAAGFVFAGGAGTSDGPFVAVACEPGAVAKLTVVKDTLGRVKSVSITL